MSLQHLKDNIKSIVNANSDINQYFDARYKDLDLKYTSLVLSVIKAKDKNTYVIKFKIFDKLSSKQTGYNKIQSNALLTIKKIVYECAKIGVMQEDKIEFLPFNDGDSTGWETNEITAIDRGIHCV